MKKSLKKRPVRVLKKNLVNELESAFFKNKLIEHSVAIDIEKFVVSKDVVVKDALKLLNECEGRVLFVVEDANKLIGALTDGDVRRYIINGGNIDDDIANIYNRNPVYVYSGYKIKDVKQLMSESRIESVPVLDRDRRVIDVLLWDSIFGSPIVSDKKKLNIPVVIMAGGKGTRLDPFTRILPKPLVPIEDRPVIELIIDRFLEYGIDLFYISVNHKSRILKAYFEECNPNYRLRWIEEGEPLGTAGCLRFLSGRISGPFFVCNCDTIVHLDCAEIFKYHCEKGNDITVVASCKRYDVPYGICETSKDGTLVQIREKPAFTFNVNIGLYLLNDSVLKYIPPGKHYSFVELLTTVKNNGGRVGVFRIRRDSWTDVGEWELYRHAIQIFRGA
jgi:NDP-sugar pyrophosphorylase family protein